MFQKSLIVLSLIFSLQTFAIEAVIEKMNGDVKVNGRPARIGQKLKERMIVEAMGKKSYVQINFDNGDIAKVRNGSMIIKKLDDKMVDFKVIRGLFFAYAEKGNSDRKMSVKTANASMGIRGTKFLVDEQETETYLCVCDGAVELSNDKGEIMVTRGEDIHASKTSELKTVEASKAMWKMATEEFAQMGLTVTPR